MGLWHRLQHIVAANCDTKIMRIAGEVWVVKECRRCGAEICRWFYRHEGERRRQR